MLDEKYNYKELYQALLTNFKEWRAQGDGREDVRL
jgi:hypothetical protein